MRFSKELGSSGLTELGVIYWMVEWVKLGRCRRVEAHTRTRSDLQPVPVLALVLIVGKERCPYHAE